jgi:CRISPR-associated endonuclease/helicase Cas3
MTIDFPAAFCALTVQGRVSPKFKPQAGHEPFRWQQRLFDDFAAGVIPVACDLPTGLGKTSVMTIWLAALDLRAGKVGLPRRLVYVVDRRAVVDQATEEARRLADNLGDGTDPEALPIIVELRTRLRLERGRRLPVSTLRGQLADNRAWLDDPTAPAIVVGTVDMIGSRILFQGYGVSPRMRPVHAALLGVDALIVLDEAHLAPPFQVLIEQVAALTKQHSERATDLGGTSYAMHPMRTMALSATGRETAKGRTFALTPEDVSSDKVVQQRVHASKRLGLEDVSIGDLAEKIAGRASELAAKQHRVLVFCNSRKTAQDVYDRLKKLLGKDAKQGTNLELIVGARRVRER